jgi:hypothetical protein
MVLFVVNIGCRNMAGRSWRRYVPSVVIPKEPASKGARLPSLVPVGQASD